MTRTVCPNCGAPWEGLRTVFPVGSEAERGVFLQHDVAVCCGSSIEYIERLEASPTIALSVRLAEMERTARIGTNVSSSDALELIMLLRRYMAFAEEMKASVERSMKNLDRLEGV